jgi:dienelactone hydrolase
MVYLRFFLAAAAVCAGGNAADSRNVQVPGTNTQFTMPAYRTLADWEARRKQLREQVLMASGLDPMPDKGALTPQVFGKIVQQDYSIEKVLLQTLPGYWLGGNLYRPVGKPGKFPGVASPHGHWNYGRLEHTPLGSIPARCINLARQGYVVFAYDMVGYNDTVQTGHGFGGKAEQLWAFHALGLQTWNSIRVVDFLQSLPDVDAGNIAATGASGGGTQTFLLTAVDDRVKVSAPVNMISGIMQGGSVCENAPGLRHGAYNVEIAALMAPRPMLMVSATGDWTRNTLEQEYPAMKGVYELYDRASLVEAVRIDAPHNYNKESREAVYQFFAKHVKKDPNWASYKEQNVRIEKLQDMLALHGRSLPPGALGYDQIFAQWKARASAQIDRITDTGERRRLLTRALGVSWPGKVEGTVGGGQIMLSRPDVGDRIPGTFHGGQGDPVLAIHPEGTSKAGELAAVKKAVGAKRPVLMIDTFQTGSAKAPRAVNQNHFLTFNVTDDQGRVQDILTALRWLETNAPGKPLIVATGAASVWARFAAATSPNPISLDTPTAFRGTDQEMIDQFFVPGIQRAGGWRSAVLLTSK